MSEDYINTFIEVLNNTFSACDQNGTGYVETNILIDCLISQEPSWLNNEAIKEEFQKMLYSDINYIISREEFIKSLQGWFEASLNAVNEENLDGKYSSSTSGIGEPSEVTSGSSTNSVNEAFSGPNFVSDGQIFTNEDLANEMSLNGSGSSQLDSRLVDKLQNEISMLIRKNEYLENMNDSLLGQVSSLEDTLAKKMEETEDYKNQLVKTNKRLEAQMKKQEETEDRMIWLTEENKSIEIKLSKSEKENTKLKTNIDDLEKKLENILIENIEKLDKLEGMTNRCNTLNDLYNKSQEELKHEREHSKSKERERKNAWTEIVGENNNLKCQLDSNNIYIEDMKWKLSAALKELSDIRDVNNKKLIGIEKSASSPKVDFPLVFPKNFSPKKSIPFETSLLAELKEEVQSDKQECCCVCKQNVSLDSKSPETVDAAVSTLVIETAEKATMTTFFKPKKCSWCTDVENVDHADRSFKNLSDMVEDGKINTFHQIKSRRSVKKWACLFGVVLVLSLLLVSILSFHVIIAPNSKRFHKPTLCLNLFLDLFHVQVLTSDTFLPIH